jgi:hypothetical protein
MVAVVTEVDDLGVVDFVEGVSDLGASNIGLLALILRCKPEYALSLNS